MPDASKSQASEKLCLDEHQNSPSLRRLTSASAHPKASFLVSSPIIAMRDPAIDQIQHLHQASSSLGPFSLSTSSSPQVIENSNSNDLLHELLNLPLPDDSSIWEDQLSDPLDEDTFRLDHTLD
jgi:hypothetical protein